MNDRGFLGYGKFTDSYGNEVTVHESSAAMGPHCWVRIEGEAHLRENPRPFVGLPYGLAHADQSSHLTVDQAIKLRDALNEFIDGVPERWSNGGAYLPESERKRLGIEWLRVAVDKDLPVEGQKRLAAEAFIDHYGAAGVKLELTSREEFDGEGAAGVWDVQRKTVAKASACRSKR